MFTFLILFLIYTIGCAVDVAFHFFNEDETYIDITYSYTWPQRLFGNMLLYFIIKPLQFYEKVNCKFKTGDEVEYVSSLGDRFPQTYKNLTVKKITESGLVECYYEATDFNGKPQRCTATFRQRSLRLKLQTIVSDGLNNVLND